MELIPKTYCVYVHTQNGLLQERNKEFAQLCEQEHIQLIECDSLTSAKDLIEESKPEIIIISIENSDPQILNCANSIYSYQSKDFNPFKIALVTADKQLDELKQGADEALMLDCSAEELLLKCQSYLRRKHILELNELTGLPSINKSNKVIKHCINNLNDWVLVHVDTLNFKSYNQMYGLDKGDIAIKQIAKTLCDSSLNGSFIGHIGRDNFVLACHSDQIEDIIQQIKLNFRNILVELYKQIDYENGYIISAVPGRIKRREGLLSLNIGYCSCIDRSYASSTDVIEQAIKNKKMPSTGNNKILLLEDDKDFENLLEETLSFEGFDVQISKGLSHIVKEVEEFKPRILMLEAASIGTENFTELCKQLSSLKKDLTLKILVATNLPGYKNFLEAGADVYVPKPYELEVLFKELRRLKHVPHQHSTNSVS